MNGKPKAPPFLCRTVEAKEVFHLFPEREHLFPIRAIKIDQKGLLPYDQYVFELEVAMKESRLVKCSKKETNGPDHFSFEK